MEILNLSSGKKPNKVEIKAHMEVTEFRRLLGYLNHLCVFETETIAEHSSVIKTGARHRFAKYLLFPVKLRKQFKTNDFDFEKLTCVAIKFEDNLFVIYKVPPKSMQFKGIKRQFDKQV